MLGGGGSIWALLGLSLGHLSLTQGLWAGNDL